MTPRVALIAVQDIAATTNVRTSAIRRNVISNVANFRSHHTAAIASSVFPVAIANAVHTGALVPTLASQAPTQTAGHTRTPASSTAARAMPVGAHTVVICSATKASRKPTAAAAT